jgi:uncharacterized protein (DUF58 family)
MITGKGAGLLASAIGLIIAALTLGLPEAAGLAAGCVLAVTASVVSVWFPPQRMTFELAIRPSATPAGTSVQLDLSMSSKGPAPRLVVVGAVSDGRRVRAWAPALPRGVARTFRFPLAVPDRGPLAIGPLRARRIGLLGLAARTVSSIPRHTVLGWPTIVECGAAPVPVTSADLDDTDVDRTVRSTTDDESQIGGLRVYAPGDDLRRIAWAASARSTELLVRLPDAEPVAAERVVVLDAIGLASSEEAFELGLSVAASLLDADPLTAVAIGPTGTPQRGRFGLDALALIRRADFIAARPEDLAPERMPMHDAILIAGPTTDPELVNRAGGAIMICAPRPPTRATIVGHIDSLDDIVRVIAQR